jgi:hypothetical protein
MQKKVSELVPRAAVLAAMPPPLVGLTFGLLISRAFPLRSIVWGGATPLPRLPISQVTRASSGLASCPAWRRAAMRGGGERLWF